MTFYIHGYFVDYKNGNIHMGRCSSNMGVHMCLCENKMSSFQRVIEWLVGQALVYVLPKRAPGQALESGCLGIQIQSASSK